MVVPQVQGVVAREVSHNFFILKPSIILLLFFSIMANSNAQNSLESLLCRHNSGEGPYISVEKIRMKQLYD